MADRSEKKFGILAYPAEHSLSPVMFKAAFDAVGITDVTYEVFEVGPEDFEEFVLGREFDGLSVSLPYKEEIMRFLDEVSDDARNIGAVNTVVSDRSGPGSVLRGFNTDWVGAVEALESECEDLKGKKVIVLGAGGAARAIVYGLVRSGADVVVLNRDLGKAEKLGSDFGVETGGLADVTNYECDVLVQATSVWITSGLDVEIISDEYVKKMGKNGGIVMDIVYKPLVTPLLEVAREAGCKIVTGENMLLHQACEQFKIWFGEEAPKTNMYDALRTALK